MARIRTIKPDFFTSEDIVSLTPRARLLYIALWCEADREGRLVWKPNTFKLRYFPGDKISIEDLCGELTGRGLVVLYGAGHAHIPTFLEHQHVNPREAQSTLPVPDASARVDDASARVEHAQVGKERNTRGKGREGKGKLTTAAKAAAEPDSFREFWQLYPKRAGNNPRGRALKAWNARCTEGHAVNEFVDGVRRYASFIRAVHKEGTEYVLQASTFLGPDKPFAQEWTKPNGAEEIDMERFIRELEERERARAPH